MLLVNIFQISYSGLFLLIDQVRLKLKVKDARTSQLEVILCHWYVLQRQSMNYSTFLSTLKMYGHAGYV